MDNPLLIILLFAVFALFFHALGKRFSRDLRESTRKRIKRTRKRPRDTDENYPIRRGQVGEDKVQRELGRLDDGFVVFNDIHLPTHRGTTTQIDHLVISPYSVTVIETKNWSGGWLFCGRKDRYWTLIRSYGEKRKRVKNPFMQNYWHLKAVARAAGLPHRHLENMVVLVDDDCELKVDRPEGLLYAHELRDHFRREGERVFSDEELVGVVDRIRAAKISELANT